MAQRYALNIRPGERRRSMRLGTRTALAGAISMVAGFGLMWQACGILTAPVTVPLAVAENGNFQLSGPIVDADGRALLNVAQGQVLHHVFWEPTVGRTETNESKTIMRDG